MRYKSEMEGWDGTSPEECPCGPGYSRNVESLYYTVISSQSCHLLFSTEVILN